jgi:hypothetical protein
MNRGTLGWEGNGGAEVSGIREQIYGYIEMLIPDDQFGCRKF